MFGLFPKSITVLWDTPNLTKSKTEPIWVLQRVQKDHFWKLEVLFDLGMLRMVGTKTPFWSNFNVLVAWRPFFSVFLAEIIVLRLIVAKLSKIMNPINRTSRKLSFMSDYRSIGTIGQKCSLKVWPIIPMPGHRDRKWTDHHFLAQIRLISSNQARNGLITKKYLQGIIL